MAHSEENIVELSDISHISDHVGAVVKDMVVGLNRTGGQSLAIVFEDGDMLLTSLTYGVDGDTTFKLESYLKKERADKHIPAPVNALPL